MKMCFPLDISQTRNIVLCAAVKENLQGSTQHHPPLRIPLEKGDINLPQGAGRLSLRVRHFWQSRKLRGCYCATTINLKSDSLVLAGKRFVNCICICCWEYHCTRQRSWEESTPL